MATSSLKSTLESTWRQIAIRQDQWNNVIDKFGAAYEMAYTMHVNNLPTVVPPLKHGKTVLSMLVKGSMLWMGISGGLAIAAMPITTVFVGLSRYMDSPPSGGTMHVPGVSMMPGVYHKRMKFALRTVMVNYKKIVNEYLSKLSIRRDITLPEKDLNRIEKLIRVSPLWYPPGDWNAWNPGVIADEFERAFWAEWAKRLDGGALFNYKFDTVQTRIKALNVDLPKHALYRLDGGGGAYRDGVTLALVNELVKWGRRYRPQKSFGAPLPPDAQKYWRERGIKPFRPIANQVGRAAKALWNAM